MFKRKGLAEMIKKTDKKKLQREVGIARRTEDGEEQIMQGCTYVTRI